jgi:hypothetical protein
MPKRLTGGVPEGASGTTVASTPASRTPPLVATSRTHEATSRVPMSVVKRK